MEQILKYDRAADRELHRAISALEQIREKKEKKEAPKQPIHAQKGLEADHENESRILKSESPVPKNESRDSEAVAISESALEALFASSARVKILRLFLQDNQQRFYLREISAKTGLWLGTVQREVTKLTDAGVLVKEVSGQQTYYRINDRCPITAGLRTIFAVPSNYGAL
jgi:DNA-binding transcriptional ArsR family regulator